MSLSIEQVFDRANATRDEETRIAYVFDDPIHYVVLTKEDNTFTIPFLNKYIEVIDQIEATTGPGVVVCIGTGSKHFSTGMDIPTYITNPETHIPSMGNLKLLLDRITRMALPTMCIFNGNAMAAGYFIGIAHDFRIMHATKGRICLNELRFGGPITPALFAVMATKLDVKVMTKLATAVFVSQSEALKDRMIDTTYTDVEDLTKQIQAFVKRYAALGAQRLAIRMNKTNQFENQLATMRNHFFKIENIEAIGGTEEIRKAFGGYFKGLKKNAPKPKL